MKKTEFRDQLNNLLTAGIEDQHLMRHSLIHTSF